MEERKPIAISEMATLFPFSGAKFPKVWASGHLQKGPGEAGLNVQIPDPSLPRPRTSEDEGREGPTLGRLPAAGVASAQTRSKRCWAGPWTSRGLSSARGSRTGPRIPEEPWCPHREQGEHRVIPTAIPGIAQTLDSNIKRIPSLRAQDPGGASVLE